MSVFDIDENIETIDESIREHKIKQLKSNQYIKFVNEVNDLKYICDLCNGDIVYVMGSDEVYMYANQWIRVHASYGNI